MNIQIKMRDGSIRDFKHEGRPGGSYTKHVRYEAAFVVVTDEWGKETAIPIDLVAEVLTDPRKGVVVTSLQTHG